MPIILHIETATEVCSVCISKGSTILSLQESKEGYIHSARITLMIESCMKEANISFGELQAVSLSQGPGSYTSLRVGTSAAKGICYAQEIPLIALDTLACLANAAVQSEQIKSSVCSIPMIDARRMEVYTAVFDESNNYLEATHAKIMEEGAFTSFLKKDNVLLFCGSGLEKCKSLLQHPQMAYSDLLCSARHLIQPALKAYRNKTFVDTAYFSPYYFKSPNITRSKKNIL